TSPGDEKFALELGADKFLRKPDGIKEILALLNDLSKLPRRVISPPPAELAVVKEYSELVVAKLEEKNAELLHRNEELRILRERLKSFFNAAPAGLCIIDSQLRYLQVNETLAAINGLPPKDHLGRTIGEVVPDLAPTLEPMLQSVLTTGTPVLNLQM